MSEEAEVWKPVVGYKDYLVSSYGRVAHIRVLEVNPATGYVSTTMLEGPRKRGDGKRPSKRLLLHRLVAEAFIGPMPEGEIVRHRDGVRAHNHAGNLRYGSKWDNAEDAREHGTLAVGERAGTAKLTEANVRAIIARAKPGNLTSLAAEFGVGREVVSAIVNGRTWQHISKMAPLTKARSPIARKGQKLTETQARAIIGRYKADGPRGLATEFNVSRYTISAIAAGKLWRHLERPT